MPDEVVPAGVADVDYHRRRHSFEVYYVVGSFRRRQLLRVTRTGKHDYRENSDYRYQAIGSYRTR